jgi:hypothetical protein
MFSLINIIKLYFLVNNSQ